MSDGKKQDQKDQQKSPIFRKVPKNVFSPSTNKRRTEEKNSTSPETDNALAQSDVAKDAAQEEGPFEDVDLSDPPPDKPEFEMVEHRDAPHSSYNTQQDHKWKYDRDFGKDQGGEDGREKK